MMVFGGTCADDKIQLVFVNEGAKINTEYYIENILESEVLPWSFSHFGNCD
uniref:Uncharacterized protein n=1 Tax=Caenorhabditis japonica TaxID=281687 RepID=A0A8R1IKW0_CAEJA